MSPVRKAIMKVLGKRSVSTWEIKEQVIATGLTKRATTVATLLSLMAKDGLVEQVRWGVWKKAQ